MTLHSVSVYVFLNISTARHLWLTEQFNWFTNYRPTKGLLTGQAPFSMHCHCSTHALCCMRARRTCDKHALVLSGVALIANFGVNIAVWVCCILYMHSSHITVPLKAKWLSALCFTGGCCVFQCYLQTANVISAMALHSAPASYISVLLHHYGFLYVLILGFAVCTFHTTDVKYVMFCASWCKSLKGWPLTFTEKSSTGSFKPTLCKASYGQRTHLFTMV